MIIENSDGTYTSFLEAGNPSDETLVLLHGIGCNKEMWQPQLEMFCENGYYVIALDLLGHGESSKVNSLSLQDWNKQISSLLKHKGLRKCSLLGVSMGGVVAQSFTIRNDCQIDKLVLSDTFSELRTLTEKLMGNSQLAFFYLFKILGIRVMNKMIAASYKEPYAHLARAYFSQSSRQTELSQLILARKAINNVQAFARIDGAKIPTLVMVGNGFGETFVGINRKIAEGIDGAKFVELENSKDPSNLVNPDRFNQEVLSFLRES